MEKASRVHAKTMLCMKVFCFLSFGNKKAAFHSRLGSCVPVSETQEVLGKYGSAEPSDEAMLNSPMPSRRMHLTNCIACLFAFSSYLTMVNVQTSMCHHVAIEMMGKIFVGWWTTNWAIPCHLSTSLPRIAHSKSRKSQSFRLAAFMEVQPWSSNEESNALHKKQTLLGRYFLILFSHGY